MDNESQQRARLVSTLWNLKRAAKDSPLSNIPFIHFNSLLRQPAYRREIIEAALNSESEEIRSLAREAQSLDVADSALLNPDDKAWLEQRDRQMAATYTAEIEATARLKRRYAMVAGALVLAVLTIVVGWLLRDQLSGQVSVQGQITKDVRWTIGRDYVLDGLVFVESGARLTIDPGVTVKGNPGSALVVSRGGFLHAKGSATQPIVFTSSQPIGRRQPGDWGGVVLLGAAPINTGSAIVEGFSSGDTRGAYGGTDPAHACGVLEYLRIEFAGFEALANNELNGLTLGGCGSDTIVRNIQVHRALDDGVELFGGTVDLRQILITQAGDDGLDWDEGWVGRIQFLITQQTDAGDNAIEADSNGDNPDAEPRSAPTIFNATLIGGESGAKRGLTLRTGSGVRLANVIASGFPVELADFRGPATALLAANSLIRMEGIAVHRVGSDRAGGFPVELGDEDDDNGFDEAAFFAGGNFPIQTLSGIRLPLNSVNSRTPSFVPSGRLEGDWPAPPKAEFWDEGARYPGAVRPGESNPWFAGWTQFPEN